MSAPFRFASDFRHRLNQLAQDVLRASGASGEAGRGGRMPGQVEFKDHRSYVHGDDPRFVDWNVFLRSETLAVKTFSQEEAPETVVILDRSASMGPPGSRQDALSREIAAAVGFLALRSGGEAVLRCAGGKAAGEPRRHLGSRAIDAWLADVESAPEPSGPNQLDVLQRLGAPPHPGRLAVWISDYLVDPLPAAGFAAFARAASQRLAFVVCAHDDVLGDAASGDAVVLADAEGDRKVLAQNDPAWRVAFGEVRGEHVAAVTALATRHQVSAVAASGESRFEDAVMAARRLR